jgi:hypothetical protein
MSHHRSSVVASADAVDTVVADHQAWPPAAESRPVWCEEPAPVSNAAAIAISVLWLLVMALSVW